MRVFLTGATGFVGSHVLTMLVQFGHQVGCLVRNTAALTEHPMVTPIPGDVTRPETYVNVLSEYDAIVNLVAVIKEKNPDITFHNINYRATANLVTAAKENRINRFIHISALGANEKSITPYFRSKGQAEQVIVSSGLNYTIIRPSFVYGPMDEVYSMLAKVIRFSPFGIYPVFGDGQYRHQPVSVLNVAEAVSKALESNNASRKVYDLGGPGPLSFNEQLQAIGQAVGRKTRLLHVPLALSRFLVKSIEWLPFSPIDSDRLTMLVQDNVCNNDEIVKDLDLNLSPFKDNLEYLN